MKTTAKITWGYLSEIILSILLTFLICPLFGATQVTSFIKTIAIDAAAYIFSILLAASVALVWTFLSKTESSFYKWLTAKGALDVYLHAAYYVIVVELIAVSLSIISKSVQSEIFLLSSTPFMFLGLINGVTMIKNIVDLIKLNIAFEKTKNTPSS